MQTENEMEWSSVSHYFASKVLFLQLNGADIDGISTVVWGDTLFVRTKNVSYFPERNGTDWTTDFYLSDYNTSMTEDIICGSSSVSFAVSSDHSLESAMEKSNCNVPSETVQQLCNRIIKRKGAKNSRYEDFLTREDEKKQREDKLKIVTSLMC